jgi:hypothetical protein
MSYLRRLASAKVIAVLTLIALLAFMATAGGGMFSPGALSQRSQSKVPLGGVASHAELSSNCAACHAPPWSGTGMASRCLTCHTDVARQLDTQTPLHGRLTQGMGCRSCHTEHKGAHAFLTNMAAFDHDCTNFQLTGKHRLVECRSCHQTASYKDTPRNCAACHAEPDVHMGRFKLDAKGAATDCMHCHSTHSWRGAAYTHVFPINHGARGRKTSCVTCHNAAKEQLTAKDFVNYTCYNCHEHQPARMEQIHARRKIAKLENCASCHRTGRGR